MTEYSFTIVIERDEDGRYLAICPALQGCYTEGESEAEARSNIVEVIEAHVADRLENGEFIPQESATDIVRIAV